MNELRLIKPRVLQKQGKPIYMKRGKNSKLKLKSSIKIDKSCIT